MEPPVIQPDADHFEVAGVRYTRTADISVARYRRLQKFELEFGFDASFKAVYDATTAIREAIDARKSVSDIAFINEGLRRGLTNIEREQVFPICVVALFYNAPGENIGWDFDTFNAKVTGWEAAGLGMGFFFTKAAGCVRGYRQAWLELMEQVSALPADPLPNPTSAGS